MKFIHCADLHLDSSINALSSEKAKLRKEELLRTFERMVDYALENSVTAIIIAGDMFDVKKVSAKTKGRIIHKIEMAQSLDFLYLSGNHDEDNFISDLEYVPQNLKIFSSEWKEFRYGTVNVSGVVINEQNSKLIYDKLDLLENDINIVVMHGQVAGYVSSDGAEIISIPLLKNKHIDYLALGHYHSFEVKRIDERGVFCYSGCLEGRGFDETGDKGFVLIDVNERIEYTFVPFAKRTLKEIEFNVSNYNSWYDATDAIIKYVGEIAHSSELVKLTLFGEYTLDFDIDVVSLSERLNELYFFAKIKDKTQLKVTVEDFVHDKGVKGEFVREVLSSELDAEMKQEIIMAGLNALKGKEL